MKLRKRELLMTEVERVKRGLHPMIRGFHQPQRDRVAKVQHPKPACGMCGGKVRTRMDYTTGDGWRLCRSCDTGPEVGLARAA